MRRQLRLWGMVIPIAASLLLVLLGALAAPLAEAPTVTGVSPASISNRTDTTIALFGEGFTAILSGTEVIKPPIVALDSLPLGDAGWISTTTLTVTVQAGFPVGVYTVTVTNPDGQPGSLPEGLTVRYPAPVLATASPATATWGVPTVLTLTGTGFVATPTVTLGETPCAVGFVSSTTLTATVPGELLPAIYDLSVANPGPESPHDVLAEAFTLASPVPSVARATPDAAPNDLDTPITVLGAGFAPTPTVTLVGPDAEAITLQKVTWVSMTQLTALVPWGMDVGAYALHVANPGPGTPSAALLAAFTVTQGIGAWSPTALYGGSVEELAVHPITPTLLYATSSFGLFRSRDGGAHWFTRLDPAQARLAFDPEAPGVIYAQGRPHDAGAFLWRSDDAGESWLPLSPPFPVATAPARGCWVRHSIAAAAGTLLVGACGEPDGPIGLLASPDRGATWAPATTGLTDTQVTALAFHATDPQFAYAGTAGGNIFVSQDGGFSWSFASRPVDYVHALAVNPRDADDVWVSAGIRLGDPCGLFRSSDATLTSWTPVPTEKPGDAWCDARVVFAPTEWDAVSASTIWIVHHSAGSRSTDGGATWHPFGPEGWLHAFAPHPTEPGTLYAGEGGGGEALYVTRDGGTTWEVANTGLTAVAPGLITAPDRPDVLYGLASTGAVYRGTQGGQAWARLPISGAISLLVDPTTPTRLYAGVDGGVRISEDSGTSWPITVTIPRPAEFATCGMSINVLAAAPAQPGVLVAAANHADWSGPCADPSGSLHRSKDYGLTWQRLDPGQPIGRVNDIVHDRADPDVMVAAVGNDDLSRGAILRSTDGGETWRSPAPWLLADGVPRALVAEPGSRRLFLNVRVGLPLYVSVDGSVSWTPTDADSYQQVLDMAYAAGDPRALYVAGLQGLYRSTDGAQHWGRAAGALGQVPVYSVAAAEAEGRTFLYVSTIGGYADTGTVQALGAAADTGTLVTPGVYRYAMGPAQRVYLPLVTR